MFITTPSISEKSKKVYIFKKEFYANKDGKAEIKVAASGKYKLFMDNTLVFCGPQILPEGNIYSDTVSLTEYLKNGANEIVIELIGEDDIFLYAEGSYEDDKESVNLSTNSSWLVSQKNEISFDNSEKFFIREYADFPMNNSFENAKETEISEKLAERTISPLTLRMRCVNILENNRDIYDAAEITTGFVKLKFSGKGKIKLVYFDSFKEKDENGNIVKNDRANVTEIYDRDFYDIISVDGEGEWESFYPRTFRYIKAEIEGDASCDYIYYIESIYPLGASVLADFGNDSYNKLWQLGVRTLQCSAREEYILCPYSAPYTDIKSAYLQMLYTYQVSKDNLLAKNTIYTYLKELSNREAFKNNDLFFALMVYDYYIRFGDDKLLNECISLVNKIVLSFKNVEFEDKTTAFILIYVIERVLYLNKATDMETETVSRLLDNINSEMILDTDNEDIQYNVWAVLSGCAEKNKKDLMLKVLNSSENIPYDFSYFVFRALEKADLYSMRDKVLENFKPLVEKNFTTIPENLSSGGECFGSGAALLYEFTAKDLGVTWEKNKLGEEIIICPTTLSGKEVKGKVVTAFGDVFVEWKRGSNFNIELYMPPEIKKVIYMPDNTIIETNDDYYVASCNI